MRLENQDASALADHVYATYNSLRWGLAVLGFIFPLLLALGGRLGYGIEWQPSMSNYYFAPYPASPQERIFPMRPWFVGLLFAIGVGLILYRGFTNWENGSLSLAGLSAVLVALVPMDIDCKFECGFSYHGAFAFLLFFCLAVAVFCGRATIAYLPPHYALLRSRLPLVYTLFGAAMVVSPLIAWGLAVLLDRRTRFIFLAEAAGVWVFAFYWAVKSVELKLSSAERLAVEGLIRPPRRKSGTIVPTFALD